MEVNAQIEFIRTLVGGYGVAKTGKDRQYLAFYIEVVDIFADIEGVGFVVLKGQKFSVSNCDNSSS